MRDSPSSDSVVREIMRVFVNRVDYSLGWHTHWVIRQQPLTPALIKRALSEPIPLGVLAVSGTGTSRWTCFDVDRDDQIPQLMDLYQGLPVESRLFEQSRRGAHVWLFHQPVAWELARLVGLERTKRHHLDGIEVYPKHGGLHAVKLPGTVHPKTGARHPIGDPITGEELDFATTLRQIVPAPVDGSGRSITDPHQRNPSSDIKDFDDLVSELATLTPVRVYAEQKAIGVCPWHDDRHPSLYVQGKRFHCLSPNCGVFGDVHDVRRYKTRSIRPPR